MLELNEAFLCALIRTFKKGDVLRLHKLLLAVCHFQDHGHHSNVTHYNLEASVHLLQLMFALQNVLFELILPRWNVDLAFVDGRLAVQDQGAGVRCNVV